MDTIQHISQLENRLSEAMKTSNTTELEGLLSDNLFFTDHTGQIHTKQEDIEAHRSGNIEIFSIDSSEQNIRSFGDVVIVSVLKNISGKYFGNIEVGIFRYTRIWKQTNDSWQVIAAHSTQLQEKYKG